MDFGQGWRADRNDSIWKVRYKVLYRSFCSEQTCDKLASLIAKQCYQSTTSRVTRRAWICLPKALNGEAETNPSCKMLEKGSESAMIVRCSLMLDVRKEEMQELPTWDNNLAARDDECENYAGNTTFSTIWFGSRPTRREGVRLLCMSIKQYIFLG